MPRPSPDIAVLDSVVSPTFLQYLTWAMVSENAQGATVRTPTGERIDEHTRRTRSVLIPPTLSEQLQRQFEDLRKPLADRFGIPLGRCEDLQFLRYERGDRFVPHKDVTDDEMRNPAPRRRVSVVLYVAHADSGIRTDAAGGHLTFFDTSPGTTWQTCRVRAATAPGAVIAFPSELLHEVTPVQRGTRLTVVTWFWDSADDAKRAAIFG